MFLAVLGLMTVSAQFQVAYAQEETPEATTEDVQAAPEVDEEEIVDPFAAGASDQPMHQALKQKFIEGGPGFMATILLCLIFGLAIAIERIITLSLAQTDTKKLIANVDKALKEGGIEKAKDVCRNTRGPVASIFYQGLLRYDQGLDVVEKTIISYGSVQSSLMENGLSWIALFIALAPSLGFLGTVIGMVMAFDDIQKAGDISPNIVAGGMKVALITTVAGLIVAMILQVFYNYILSRIENLTIDMEDGSISLMDILTKYEEKKK